MGPVPIFFCGASVAALLGVGSVDVVPVLMVSQHKPHTLLVQIQSLSQSSFDKHAAPKQCPGHVHAACVAEVEAIALR
jgi:hypothetical protein